METESLSKDILNLILDLDKRINDRVKLINVTPTLIVAHTEKWSIDTIRNEPVLSRRFRCLKTKQYKRQSISPALLADFIDPTAPAELYAFRDRLNYFRQVLKTKTEVPTTLIPEEQEFAVGWICQKIIDQFQESYKKRDVNDETALDVTRTVKQVLLLWPKVGCTDPLEWADRTKDLAYEVLQSYNSPSRAKKAKQRFQLFMTFLSTNYPTRARKFSWRDELTDGAIAKHYRKIDPTWYEDRNKEAIRGKYVPNHCFLAIHEFLDDVEAGTIKIPNPKHALSLRPYLNIARQAGPRRNELLMLFGRSGDVLWEEYLLIDRQLIDWEAKQKWKLPKHDIIRRVSHFFVTPAYLKVQIDQMEKLTENQLSSRLKMVCEIMVAKKLIPETYEWHDFRRTFITDAYRFFDLNDVQTSAGHGSSAVTDQYLKEIKKMNQRRYTGEERATDNRIFHWFNGKLIEGVPETMKKAKNLGHQNQLLADLVQKVNPELAITLLQTLVNASAGSSQKTG